jgi:putative ABC transport system permease protein
MLGKLTIRGLLAHKARFLLAMLAVVLGVAFVSGTFILTDSIRKTFDDLFTDVNKGVDVEVRTKLAFGSASDTTRDPVADTLVETVRAVDGVKAAEGGLFRTATIVDKKGKAITTQGAPTAGLNYDGPTPTSGVTLISGVPPKSRTELVMDKATADDHGFQLGDTVEVVLPIGRQSFTLVGLIGQSDQDGFAGATIVGFSSTVAQELLGSEGYWDVIDLAAEDGVSDETLRDRVAEVLPDGVEAVTGEVVAKETSDAIGSFIGVFGNVLLGFACVALFVSAFIINNTFAIILGQRLRELALLRAIGAGAGQVRAIIISEALAIGLLSSGVGLAGGLGVAKGIIALFNAAGAGFPPTTTVISARTITAALAVGIVVTLLSALVPTMRAGRIPPVAAMRIDEGFAALSSNRRGIIATLTTVIGIVLTGIGLFVRPGGTMGTIGASALGAIMLFLGIASLSASIARPVTRVLGAPVARLFGISGRLSRENASRQPRRTAATASALMIGIALVSTFAVVGQSFKSTISDLLDRSVTADYFITDDSFQGIPIMFAEQLAKVPGIESVSGFRVGRVQVNGDAKQIGAIDPQNFGKLVDLNVSAGSLEALDSGGVLVQTDPAKDLNLKVGSTVDVLWPNGTTQQLPVVGIYKDAQVIGTNWLVSTKTFSEATTSEQRDFFVGAQIADGADPQTVRSAVDQLAEDFPGVKVEDRAEFQQSQEDQVNQTLVIVNALLGLAVIIALIGIANTLALAVFERTRELGLMRAVGMSRRQLKRMVRWEAVIVSVFGAMLGIVVGTLLGVALANALPATLITVIRVPYGTLIGLVITSIVVGLMAAIWPARRAAKLNVLDSIATT